MSHGDFQDGTKAFEKTKIVDPLIGKTLDGRYEIQCLLGMGGMGAVYQANHVDLGKLVAVKIMHQQLMLDERTVRRFRHEIKAMSKLSHPNLTSIMDVGTTDFGAPYFVMEFIKSKSLAQLLQQEVFLPPERATAIAIQIAEALSHAHENNIIHRDLKPANILIVESSAKDFVKVVDLGVAKLIGGDDATTIMKLTQTGEVFGSPLYMAPEQILGKLQDGRTDVYQLGCVIFEMLAGVPPIMRQSAIATMNGHVQDPAPTFTEVMPDLPMDAQLTQLQTIVLKCLEKEPERRFQSMEELVAALGGAPVPASTLAKHADKPGKEEVLVIDERSNRKQLGLMLVIGGVVALLIGVVFFVLLLNITPRPTIPPALPVVSGQQTALPPKEVIVEYPEFKSDRADLRVLSVYEGLQKPNQPANTEEREGAIDVNVYNEGKPLILVLNSYMPTTWTIKPASERVKIGQVITVGYYPQTVKNLPSKAAHTSVYYEYFKPDGGKSETRTHSNAFGLFYFLYMGEENMQSQPEFTGMKAALEKLSSCHLRSFQGTRSTGSFSVR